MAKRVVLAVFDSAVQTYGQPFFVAAIGAGSRSFADEVNRRAPDNTLANHPEDFDLRYLGEFDDETGSFSRDGEVRVICRGKEVKNDAS